MRLRKKVITAKWLKERYACEPAIKAFRAKFGEKAPVQDVAKALLRSRLPVDLLEDWRYWLFSEVLRTAEWRQWRDGWQAPGCCSFREYAVIDRKWLRKIANS